jgi:hypothetical protein
MRYLAFTLLFLISSISQGETYEEYWNKWHDDAEKVSKCLSSTTVESFLTQALDNIGNAERNEANSEVIEYLIIRDPDCFCNAFLMLPAASQGKLKQFHLSSPVYHTKEEIDAALYSNKISRQCHAF